MESQSMNRRELENAIDETRRRGDYKASAEKARELFELLSSMADAKPFEIDDVRRLHQMLERVAGMSGESQIELAEADRLDATIDAQWQRGAGTVDLQHFHHQLAIRRRILGDDALDVASTLTDLGWALVERGDFAGAEPYCRQGHALRERLLGHHPDVATSLNNLAMLLYSRGEYEAAEPLCRKALEIRRKHLGNEHAYVVISLNNLGTLLRVQGDYVAAESLYREAVAMTRKALGDEHIEVAAVIHNLTLIRQS